MENINPGLAWGINSFTINAVLDSFLRITNKNPRNLESSVLSGSKLLKNKVNNTIDPSWTVTTIVQNISWRRLSLCLSRTINIPMFQYCGQLNPVFQTVGYSIFYFLSKDISLTIVSIDQTGAVVGLISSSSLMYFKR